MSTAPPSALNWEGETIIDREGEKIGTIEEVFLVEETGRPEWALVKTGRIKGHTTLAPLKGAHKVSGGVKIYFDKDLVSGAPQVDPSSEPSEQQVNEVYRHYGLPVPDEGSGSAGTNGGAVSAQGLSTDVRPAPPSNGSHGDLRDEPVSDLVKQVSDHTKTLASQEIQLAKAELAEKAKVAGVGAGMFGGAGYVLHLAALAFVVTIIFALATAMQAWLAALIVTVVLAAVAGVLALTGRKRIKEAGPLVPEQTIESVKQTIDTVKEEARWGLGQTR
jgi:uncharacterized membrane protein YqjE/sporulation protein YlmC with PRC-barrel domain